MSDDPGLKATTTLRIDGVPAVLSVTRGAERWQFFAFVFAAAVTLALTLIDEIPDARWRVPAKAASFVVLAYLLLRNNRVRDRLARVLQAFKEERS